MVLLRILTLGKNDLGLESPLFIPDHGANRGIMLSSDHS